MLHAVSSTHVNLSWRITYWSSFRTSKDGENVIRVVGYVAVSRRASELFCGVARHLDDEGNHRSRVLERRATKNDEQQISRRNEAPTMERFVLLSCHRNLKRDIARVESDSRAPCFHPQSLKSFYKVPSQKMEWKARLGAGRCADTHTRSLGFHHHHQTTLKTSWRHRLLNTHDQGWNRCKQFRNSRDISARGTCDSWDDFMNFRSLRLSKNHVSHLQHWFPLVVTVIFLYEVCLRTSCLVVASMCSTDFLFQACSRGVNITRGA